MLTREKALAATEFHREPCREIIGPRGGRKLDIMVWRKSGKVQVWKTRPTQFRVPVKYGLRSYGSINHLNSKEFHAAEDCPLLLKPGDKVHARMTLADLSPWGGL